MRARGCALASATFSTTTLLSVQCLVIKFASDFIWHVTPCCFSGWESRNLGSIPYWFQGASSQSSNQKTKTWGMEQRLTWRAESERTRPKQWKQKSKLNYNLLFAVLGDHSRFLQPMRQVPRRNYSETSRAKNFWNSATPGGIHGLIRRLTHAVDIFFSYDDLQIYSKGGRDRMSSEQVTHVFLFPRSDRNLRISPGCLAVDSSHGTWDKGAVFGGLTNNLKPHHTQLKSCFEKL